MTKVSTLRDVAARAGVSVATASRAINGLPYVSSDVRARVLEASEALEYRPDMAARGMRTGLTGTIGFVVSDIANPLFAAIAKGADATFSPAGYSLVVANSSNDAAHEAELITTLRQRRLEGLIIAAADERAPGLAERIAAFRAVVLLDREVPGANADAVLCDHGAGLGDALAHLARLGHRRIALVVGSPGQRGSRVRLAAFREQTAKLGLDRDEELVRAGELSRETGYRAASELFRLRRPVTAVIAGNNQLFAGVLSAMRDRGLAAPRDVSLVACDDTELTGLLDPPVDVVRRDVAGLGRAVAELLLRRLRDGLRAPATVWLPTTFEARASSGAPPADGGGR